MRFMSISCSIPLPLSIMQNVARPINRTADIKIVGSGLLRQRKACCSELAARFCSISMIADWSPATFTSLGANNLTLIFCAFASGATIVYTVSAISAEEADVIRDGVPVALLLAVVAKV